MPLVEKGNIDLHNRPKVKNADGSISTVRSISYRNKQGQEVLIPTVSNEGKILSNQDAIKYWGEKGQHLGKFDDVASANAYAQSLHEEQAKEYVPQAKAQGQAPMAQGINDHSTALAERDTKKKKAFQPDPDTGRIGAQAMQTGESRPQAMGSSVGGNPSAPSELGSLITPSVVGTEPPPSSPEELEARTQRNATFLSNPTVKAQLLQFGLGALSAAGRGNFNFGGAIQSAIGLPARARAMNLKYNQGVQEMNIKERGMQIDEERLKLEEAKFLREGGMKFSRVITADDPINEKFGLGIPAGGSARVEFTTDANNKIRNASVEAPYGEQEKTPEIVTLRKQADKLDAEGDSQGAALLRQRADTIATGANPKLAGGVAVPDKNSPTGYRTSNVPGSEAEQAAKEAADKEKAKQDSAESQANIVLDRIDKATGMLNNSVAPNVLISGGVGNLAKYIPFVGQESLDFQETIATIKANNTVRQLSKMREEAKSGASGLGQVTEFEDRMLAAVTGSLEQHQSAKQLVENLGTVRQVYNAIINTGALSEIGHMVDDNIITEQEGIQRAAAILAPEGDETQSPLENGKTAIPFPESVPNLDADQITRAKAAWPFMDDQAKKDFIEGN